MKKWLFIDANFLCYRNHHAMGELSFGDLRTGVLFGFLKDLLFLQEAHRTYDVAFCFDYGKCKRLKYLPTYKSARKKQREELNDEQKALRQEFLKQVDWLREKWLPRLGFRNILFQDGYEADDIIASLCRHTLKENEDAIVVSSDKDLLQLLAPNISIWDPNHRSLVTMQDFYKKYGMRPKKWWRVRALAGCNTDCVPGIDGVGEVTALRYLTNDLPTHYKAFTTIAAAEASTLAKNKILVKLPFPGCERFELTDDEVTINRWERVCDALGIRSIREFAPIPTRTRKRHGTRER